MVRSDYNAKILVYDIRLSPEKIRVPYFTKRSRIEIITLSKNKSPDMRGGIPTATAVNTLNDRRGHVRGLVWVPHPYLAVPVRVRRLVRAIPEA